MHIRRLFRACSERFKRSERGSATIEFVIVFPAFMILFISAFELGLLQIRHTMLERGLDIVVRDVRLSTNTPPSYNQLKKEICNEAALIPDCLNNLKIEMVRIDPRVGVNVPPAADCVDRAQEVQPVRSFSVASNNDLMLLRVCSLFDPIFPTSGLGFQLPKASGGAYALVSMTAFVSEPG